jgi:hypothetical protein
MEAFRNSSSRINLSSKSTAIGEKFRNKKSASVGDDTKEHFEANEVQITLSTKFDKLALLKVQNIELSSLPTENTSIDTPSNERLMYIDFSTYK